MKATNVVIQCILMSDDDTEPENYRFSENKKPGLCHCRHNNKAIKSILNYKYLKHQAIF